MLRKQMLLRYKYSRALRRRQRWDSEPVHNASRPALGWQRTEESSPNEGQASTFQASTFQASVPRSDTKSGVTEPHAIDDFTQFKAWVDKDPFTAVFGQRLARLQSPTVTSWSPFSWILDPKITHESAASNTPPPSRVNDNVSSNSGTNTRVADGPPHKSDNWSRRAANTAEREDEYEFDPISMRKVLKSTPVVEAPPKASKPLFDPLFTEKGINIPVKSYKPPRVFGHGTRSSTGKSEKKEGSSDCSALRSKVETSRFAELRSLKAATLGNSIDTTAEYHGKWVPADEKATVEAMKETVVEPPTDEAPLFSGTTYQGKSRVMVMQTKIHKKDWLNREGFGSKEESVVTTHNGKPYDTDLLSGKSASRLQPSLDRLNVPLKVSGRLEPSLDRLKASSEEPTLAHSFKKPTSISDETRESNSEDLDLLRASDIRASTRTFRWTKRDSRKAKQDQRQKLEDDFRSHQKDDDGLSIIFPKAIMESSKRLSESLNNLWHRVRAQQGSWLAQEKSSVESSNHEAREARMSDVKIPTNVRRASTRPIQTFTPSKEVLDAEQQNKDRTLALRNATLEAARMEAETKAKEKDLARTIKATYEEEYGPITVDHRQAKGLERVDKLAETIKEAKIRADRNAVKNMFIQCEHALREAKVLREEIIQKIKAIQARAPSSQSYSVPWSTKSTGRENVATEVSTETAEVVSEQTPASPELSSSRTPLLYKVLAYDSSTLQMNIAETTSSVPAAGDAESQPLHPTEVLSRLNNVAKFLPYFADMEKQGYEMVSGSGDVLVFKKVRATLPIAPPTAPELSSPTMETSPKPSTPPSQSQPANETVSDSFPAPPPNSPKIRRQEPVFSGSGQTWHHHQDEAGSSSGANTGTTQGGWFRRTIKPVVLTAALGAAAAYAVGVVAERGGEGGPRQPGRPVRVGRPGIFSTEDSR